MCDMVYVTVCQSVILGMSVDDSVIWCMSVCYMGYVSRRRCVIWCMSLYVSLLYGVCQ